MKACCNGLFVTKAQGLRIHHPYLSARAWFVNLCSGLVFFFSIVHEVITGFTLQQVAGVSSGALSNNADMKLQTDACSCDGCINLLLSQVATLSALLSRQFSRVGLLGTGWRCFLPHMDMKRDPIFSSKGALTAADDRKALCFPAC